MDALHAYLYGTSFWYFLRGAARILSPATVVGWFHPDVRPATGLEVYMARTDAFGLEALAMLTLVMGGAVDFATTPISSSASGASTTSSPYVKPTVVVTMLHHLFTAFWAYLQYADSGTTTPAFTVGVVGSTGLALLAGWTLLFGMEPNTGRTASIERRKAK